MILRSFIGALALTISFSASAKQVIKPVQLYGGDDVTIMSTPTGIAIDEQDNIYVTETGSNRISKFTASGELVGTFLEGGRDAGQINAPAEAFYKNGILYVAELGNDRVTRLTSDGTFIDTIGEGQLEGPRALYVEDNGTMHVMDEFDNTVKVFNDQGELISSCTNSLFFMPNDIEFDGTNYYISNTNAQTIIKTDAQCQTLAMAGEYAVLGSDDSHFYFPRGIKVIDGNVYVADSSNNQVKVFNSELEHIVTFGGLGVLSGPSSVDKLSTGEIAVVSSGEALVKVFDPADYSAPASIIGNYRIGEDIMSSPNAVAYDKNAKEIYVADYANSRVIVFGEKKGEVIREIGQLGYGSNPGDLLVVGGVKIAGDYLYVTSMFTHDVVVFTKQGEQVARFGGFGTEIGQFNRPYSVDVADNGDIYIGELMGGRIQKFSSSFEPLGIVGTPGFGPGMIFTPIRITLLPENKMLVADYYAHKVVELDLDTNEVINEFGSYGLEEGQLFYPFGINTDKKGKYILVGEAGNNRITVLTRDFQFVKTIGQIGTLDDDFFFPSDIIRTKKNNEYVIPNRISNKAVKLKIKICNNNTDDEEDDQNDD